MLEIIFASVIIMLASLVGVVSIWKKIGSIIERNLTYLVSFSAGVFLIISYQLSQEAMFHNSNPRLGAFWIALGAIFILTIFKLIPSFHHHHDEHEEDHHHSLIDARRIIASDGIHNIGDGILLATSITLNPALGVATAISIFIHELVQETSEFFVMRQAGYPVKKILAINLAVSSTILLGSLGGYFLLDNFEALETPLLGLAAGSFFVVVLHDLIPHSVRMSHHNKHYRHHFIWFLAGALLMSGVNALTVHEHENIGSESEPTTQNI